MLPSPQGLNSQSASGSGTQKCGSFIDCKKNIRVSNALVNQGCGCAARRGPLLPLNWPRSVATANDSPAKLFQAAIALAASLQRLSQSRLRCPGLSRSRRSLSALKRRISSSSALFFSSRTVMRYFGSSLPRHLSSAFPTSSFSVMIQGSPFVDRCRPH